MVLILLQACQAQRKPLSGQEVRSEVRTGISAAAEARLFLDSVDQGRLTVRFSQAHPLYLAEEIGRSISELTSRECPPALQPARDTSREMLDRLYDEVTALPATVEPGRDREAARKRIAEIQGALERIQATQ